MKLIGKLASNDMSKIVMLPSVSKDNYVKFEEQCLHILNNNHVLNVLKGITKMKNIESPIKYQ